MPRILLFIGGALAIGAVLLVVGVRSAMSGVSRESVEAEYLTEHDEYLAVGGLQVRMRREGAKDAPALVLVHGFSHSLESWDGWTEELSSEFQIVRMDLPGHGLTGPDPQKRYTVEETAGFIGEFMDAAGIGCAAIGGVSLGGLAAWRFAAAAPDRARALILVNPGAYPMNGVGDEPADVPGAVKLFLTAAPEAGILTATRAMYGDPTKVTDAQVARIRAMMRVNGVGAALVERLEAFTLPDPEPVLREIAAPTLVMAGGRDVMVTPSDTQRVGEVIPGAELIAYESLGHMLHEEAPVETAQRASVFLRSLPREDLSCAVR